MDKFEKNPVVERMNAERRAERETYLGAHALSVQSIHLSNLAPKGWNILHVAGNGPYRVDEKGSVHFEPPIRAVVLEQSDMRSSSRIKKVVDIELPPAYAAQGLNGNFFVPFITEHDSDLYREFQTEYMPELIADRSWRDKRLPGRKRMRSMTKSEEAAWEAWVRTAASRDPAEDAKRWKIE